MRRSVAVSVHVVILALAAALYFLFVLPRWWELMGEVSHGLGTVIRIVTGALIGLNALPVVFTLLRSRRPEFGTPQLALTLRTWSIVLHVLAGALIVGAAISELWLHLDSAGQWLFGSYGAAAAIALLGALTFYLAYVAELPPPPPKPLKPKEKKRRRARRKAAEEQAAEEQAAEEAADQDASDEVSADEAEAVEDATEEEPAEVTAEGADDEPDAKKPEAAGQLRNRRPSGKGSRSRLRRRTRGGVATEN